jgi:hypothetical protein
MFEVLLWWVLLDFCIVAMMPGEYIDSMQKWEAALWGWTVFLPLYVLYLIAESIVKLIKYIRNA